MIGFAAAESPSSLLTEVHWNWEWSAWTTLGVAAAAAWVVLIYVKEQAYVRPRVRGGLAILRMLAVGAVFIMLASPTVQQSRVAQPRIALLLDRSASMTTRDVPAADLANAGGATAMVSRAEAWENLLTAGEAPLLEKLQAHFQVVLIPFASDAKIMSPGEIAASRQGSDADLDATHLGDAIDYALRRLPGPLPAAVVAFTDGVNTGGLSLANAAARAQTLDVPLYAVALGSDRPRPDVSIEDVAVEEVVFPGDRLQLEVAVRSVGFAGKEARLTLKHATENRQLAETELRLPEDGQVRTVRLSLRPTTPGPLPLVVTVAGQPGEDDLSNNRAELTIDVRDQPIRTLLVASSPSFEYRALKSLLERDPAVELRVWLQDADADYAAVEAAALRAFPATEAEWLAYDVVILADVDPQPLPRQTWELLDKFVSKHGGGLVLIAGEQYLPRAFADVDGMRALLPIEVDGFGASLFSSIGEDGARIEPTPLGRQDASLKLGETRAASEEIWRRLPVVLWVYNAERIKPGVQVLAVAAAEGEAGDPPPVIMRHYVGAGEVLTHATDATWRWRWRNDDRYFARYWGQAVRRLARGRALRGVGTLSTNRSEYEPGAPVTIRLRPGASSEQAADEPVVELIGESTPTREIVLPRKGGFAHVFETTLRDLPADQYTVRRSGPGAAALTTEFTVVAPPDELARLTVNSAGLKEAAAATGGAYYNTKTVDQLLDDLPQPKPTAVERLPEKPLWNSSWLVAVVCMALAAEWLVRRRSGML